MGNVAFFIATSTKLDPNPVLGLGYCYQRATINPITSQAAPHSNVDPSKDHWTSQTKLKAGECGRGPL